MKLELKPGKYVVAVSGGVDSVVLLDLLYEQLKNPEKNLAVAHFDHGIRENSDRDRKFVEKLAQSYKLQFFYEEGGLGPQASEALARQKRYEFLKKVKEQTNSSSIVTAHHQDDVLETIIINLLRGTGRKGLSSLASHDGLARPLLNFPKSEILDYAKSRGLRWQEDESNLDQKYLRNYIRHNLVNKLSRAQKKKLLEISRTARGKNRQIDESLQNLFFQNDGIPRKLFVSLSHDISSEIIAQWLRRENARLDKKTIDRLVIQLKTARQGKIIEANQAKYFVINQGIIRLKTS